MLKDLAESAIGLLLCPLVFVLPGYAIGHVSEVFDFGKRSVLVKVAISLMLSVAVGPIVLYFALHGGWLAVLIVYGFGWGIAVVSLVREHPPARPLIRPALVCLGVALLLVILQIDIGWGDRLYFSTAARDFVRTIALTNEVRVHGIPPLNPMFFSGEGMPLFYYYGWMLLTGFVDFLGGTVVGARGAVFAGTAFCALALMGTVASYVVTSPNPLAQNASTSTSTRRVQIALVLLLVGGLDIVVFLAGAAALHFVGRPIVITDIEWWNEPVLMWITSVLTAPHHVAGLIAGLAGFRLARFSMVRASGKKWKAIVLSSAAFASSVLCSIWIGMGVAIIGVAWVVGNALRNQWREVRQWVIIGSVGGLFTLPFLFYLRSAGEVEGSPIGFGVRLFGPLEKFFGISSVGSAMLAHLTLLPLGYALEYGFFAFAGVLFWWLRRRDPRPLTQDERLLRVILAVGILFPTFVFAAVRNNDLGFRAPMLAQFVLLLWSADLISALRLGSFRLPKKWMKPALVILFAIGLASSISNMFVTRFATPAADAGLIAMPGMYGADRELGVRTKALREAYSWLQLHTPETSIVQHNPQPGVERRKGGYVFAPALYGQRHTVVYDDDMGTMYGVTHGMYDPIAAEVASVFSNSDAANLASVASNLGIDAIVVTDLDFVWKDSTSWVWGRPADFSNSRVRVFLDPARFSDTVR